ncbi:MAG TPA: RNB domain-containing ribonuclease [Vicinamibacterales bacterium]|jgi:exoribonuclease-2
MHDPTIRARAHRDLLRQIARQAMLDYHLQPDFSPAALAELAGARPAARQADGVRDLRGLLWCSIDNDDSLDLDQLSVANPAEPGPTRILVAIADVDALVAAGSAIDGHARQNTTTVYTPATIFPMLPERLSTDLTSLGFDQDRRAIVVDMAVAADGTIETSDVYAAVVRNHAKLAYDSVAAWLEGQASPPPPLAAVPGLVDQLKTQDLVAQLLRKSRLERGALEFQTLETRAVFDGDTVRELAVDHDNRARNLIEDFMIAANGATAQFLERKKYPSIRRVVRSPERWDRIEALAAQYGTHLPPDPDSGALAAFLAARRAADPLRFPDLSLSVIKLLGAGEYVVEHAGEEGPGHFGLAVKDYTHSTAPNRRYPDVLTQRLLKAAMSGAAVPYPDDELTQLATHCTEMEDEAHKVERRVRKAAAALLLESRIGEVFDGVVTGASPKGTWVRIFHPPVEGRVERGFEGVDVGDRIRVKLIHTDAPRGFIDFARV